MPVFYDQLNRGVNLPSVPKRIISVVPSQTELLFYLGLDEEIIGITKFCIHPADKFKSTTKIGGTKQLDIAKIISLKPDLIIANKEENERSQLEELMQHFPVWISDISDLDGALQMIAGVGALVGKHKEALALNNNISLKFNELKLAPLDLHVAYFIWRKPYMVAGKNTFIDDMLQKCGLVNAFEKERYPEIDALLLREAKPDVILLSSEPYPFKEKHIVELKAIIPNAVIKLVDGEMFSWYGSRLLDTPAYFNTLISELI
ncbi:helical backbone metal receptor [Mucilaginibacter sp. OK098]|uniref:helical backbone metal receptor n=1 Tax=Mucilaginibacter sp. OK098 TaxID=1855297 RepID=UPI00091F81A4|nr:helical backbone metal receptor [Mucilaginibacter sp. OK098]SHM03531.1 ABC-type Fe3+-hydroxamate transport system, substrate-binding protein [Mucilaginibacter sp. OK098]